MPLSPDRIITPGQTPHAHERDAFDFVVRELPDMDPYRLWAFVDLVDKSGRRYDIDLLILGYHALYVIEVKSHVGKLAGDEVDWHVTFPDGGRTVFENPLRATNLKAKVLGTLLEERFSRDPDARSRSLRRPWVQPLVFLSAPDLVPSFSGAGGRQVVTRKTFLRAITHGEFPGAGDEFRDRTVNRPTAGATQRLLKDMGLRPSVAALKVQDLVLGELLEDGSHYQDRLGVHPSIASLKRRVRTFIIPANTTADRRDRLRRAAAREAKSLTALSDHRNILRLVSYTPEGPLGGPCVILEHVEGAVPLDAFLRANPDLSFEDRLTIIQQIAEALEFCHRKQIVHRGLSPRAVLVRRAAGTTGPIEVRLYNFQLASSEDSSGTTHLGSQAPVYVAPEVIQDPATADPISDVFSLGAIAYFVLTGRPPGNTLAERGTLLASGRLSVAAARDDLAGGKILRPGDESSQGSPTDETTVRLRSLDEVVGLATCENRHERADSAIGWLNLLLDTATTPSPPEDAGFVSPLQAGPNQLLAPDLLVVDVLGKGSTARVLRVRRGETDYALKVALAPELEERLEQEARVLGALHEKASTDRIVALVEKLELGGVLCLLVTYAGETLSTLLSREGPPSLDFARRWGENLLDALETLEDHAIQHRDIKPANLGVLGRESKKKQSLLLFDFSLAGASNKAITGGTPAYRDPFLDRRETWDAAADRWAAAMSLHELLTGVRPGWGDGTETAAASEGEIRIAAERFDPSGNVRPKLTAFFRKALARDVAARFPSAEAMRTEWTACFATLRYGEEAPAEQAAPPRTFDFTRVGPDTPIAALGLSARAENALDRAGMTLLSELLQMPRNRLLTTRGIGRQTHQEIQRFIDDARASLGPRAAGATEAPFLPDYRGPAAPVGTVPTLPVEAAAALEDAGLGMLSSVAAAPRTQVERVLSAFPNAAASLREHLRAGAPPVAASGSGEGGGFSGEPATIEDWVEQLFARTAKRDKFLQTAAQLLGVEGEGPRDARTLASALGVTQAAVHIAFGKARDRWRAHLHLAALHARLDRAIERAGEVAPLARVAAELVAELPHRSPAPPASPGSPPAGADVAAEALVRIAAETHPDAVQGRIHDVIWIASAQADLALARELGRRADDLARREPLPSTDEVRDALTSAVEDTSLAALPHDRLVALAAEASRDAARSARLELYPRKMEARRALALSATAISPVQATPESIRQIVRARYPEAEPPPEGDALHALMASLQFRWDAGRNAYARIGAEILTDPLTVMPLRQTTTHTSHRPSPSQKENQEALEFEARLRLAVDKRNFRVLDVTAGYDRDAAAELARRFRGQVVSLEGEIIAEMDRLAAEKEVDPALIEETDRQGPAATDDWANLCLLARAAAGRALDRTLSRDGGAGARPLVLTHPGILARYQLDEALGRLVQYGQGDDARAMFLVNPTDEGAERACIDSGTTPLVVPLPSQAQRLKVPQPWIENIHRGGVG